MPPFFILSFFLSGRNRYRRCTTNYNGGTATADFTIPSGKYYLPITNAADTRSFKIDSDPTAVSSIVSEPEAQGKWYDMQGRRINKPTRAGLYIVDGKKTVVNTKEAVILTGRQPD